MSTIRSGNFYPVWPLLDGKPLSHQWGQIRQNTAETKAIVRNSVQELGPGDTLNAVRAYLGQEFGDLDFRNRYRFFFNSATEELRAQINDGTEADPVWRDAWHIQRNDGKFVADGAGGITSDAGFYGPGLRTIAEVAESGSEADATHSVKNPSKIFFNANDGFGVEPIPTGANAGSPEIKFTQPFGRAQTYQKAGKVWEVNHEFGTSPLMVQVMDMDDRVVIPDKADLSDPDVAHFYFNEVFTGKVLIASGGLGSYALRPRDPFYIVVRTGEQSSHDRLFQPNLNLVFDRRYFYVNTDLDDVAGGSNPNAFVSLTNLNDGTSRFNTVQAEGFYAPGGELAGEGIKVTDGTVSTPSIAFSSETDSGLYRPGDGEVGLAVGGEKRVTFGTSGGVSFREHVTAEAFYLTSGGEISALTVREQDNIPTINNINTLVFTSGTVTDDGNGQASIDIAGGGGGSRPDIHDENNSYVGPTDITFANEFFYFTNTSTGTPVVNLQPPTVSGVFNVKDYGAVGNGIVDDATAIQAALLACYDAGGGTVYAPTGTYAVGANLVTYSNVWFRGDGPGATILQQTAGAGDVNTLDVHATLNTNITIADMKFDVTLNALTDNTACILLAGGTTDTRINNVHIEGSLGKAISLFSSTDDFKRITLTNLYLKDSGSSAIDIKDAVGTNESIIISNVTIDGVAVNTANAPGIKLEGPATISNLHVVNLDNAIPSTSEGVDFQRSSAGADRPARTATLSEFVIEGSGSQVRGLRIDGHNVVISGGVIDLREPGSGSDIGIIINPNNFLTYSPGDVTGNEIAITSHGYADDHGPVIFYNGTSIDSALESKAAYWIKYIDDDTISVLNEPGGTAITLAGDTVGSTNIREAAVNVSIQNVKVLGAAIGIKVGGYAYRTLIQGCDVSETTGASIEDQGLETTITGNVVNGRNNSATGAIKISSDSKNAVVQSNTISHATNSGLDIGSSVSGAIVASNTFRNNASTISNLGQTSLVKYNVGHAETEPIIKEAFYFTDGGEAPRSYAENFSSSLEWIVNHDLERTDFIAQAYNSIGSQVIPDTIEVSDISTAYFYFAEAQAGKAVILGFG